MSTKPEDGGIYKIINAKARNVLTMDISLASAGPPAIGFDWFGGDIQKWRLTKPKEKDGKPGRGWIIESIGRPGKFLAPIKEAQDAVHVHGTTKKVKWHIKETKKDSGTYRLFVLDTPFNLDLAGHGDPAPGIHVGVWGAHDKNKNQCWQFQRLNDEEPDLNQRKWKPGVYTLTNMKSATALSALRDQVVGFPVHGGTSQQWLFDPFGTGYTIQSVSSGLYLTVCSQPKFVTVGEIPVCWEVDPENQRGQLAIRILWPAERAAVALGNSGRDDPRTEVVLEDEKSDHPWHHWRAQVIEHGLVRASNAATEPTGPMPIITSPVTVNQSISEPEPTDMRLGVIQESDHSRVEETVVTDGHFVTTTRTTVSSVTVVIRSMRET